MLDGKIYCLMSGGISLTNETRTELFLAACSMAQKGNVHRMLRKENFEGMVTTERKRTCLAGMSGIVFDAEIETGSRKGKVRFIVRPIDITRYNREDLRFTWT